MWWVILRKHIHIIYRENIVQSVRFGAHITGIVWAQIWMAHYVCWLSTASYLYIVYTLNVHVSRSLEKIDPLC